MDTLEIGSIECPINQIVMAIDKEESSKNLEYDFKDLTAKLGTPSKKWSVYERDLLLKRQRAIDVLGDILVDWRSRESQNAKLVLLINLMNEITGWEARAEAVSALYRHLIVSTTRWHQLDIKTQQKILDGKIEIAGRVETLRDYVVSKCNNDADRINFLEQHLDGNTMISLLQGNIVRCDMKSIAQMEI